MLIAVNLSLIGGFLDAYTYVLKGGVFANAQTGNVVLLSLSLLRHGEADIMKYLLPVIFFCCGILFAEAIRTMKILQIRNRKSISVLAVEALIIVLIFLGTDRLSNFVVTCLISFLAALQVRTFNKIYGSNFASTMVTGNLRTTMESLFSFITTRDRKAGFKVLIYLGVIISFGCGACLGAVCSSRFQEPAILICLFFLLFTLVLILIQGNPDRENASGNQ